MVAVGLAQRETGVTTNATLRKTSKNGTADTTPETVRVGIYCRKSLETGLDQNFNSLDAQRSIVESYVASQKANGWIAIPDHFDDGGYTGANTQRPAFQRLMAEVQNGRVDVVATYRLDRLSRSQRDFFTTLDFLEKHGVTFVSVTEQFNTTTSHGRFALSISVAVAQLEREVTAQRTAEKVAATRRAGRGTGGRPILGLDPAGGGKLVVNAAEADVVRRKIFARFFELHSVSALVRELLLDGVTNKTWTNRKGDVVRGKPFNKSSLRRLLSNPLLVGDVPLGDERHKGIHEAVISRETYERALALLADSSAPAGSARRNKWDVLLAGLVFCAVDGCRMQHHYAAKGGRRYSAFVCSRYAREGARTCPGSRISVRELDDFVLTKIRAIGRDPELVTETIAAARRQVEARRPALADELQQAAAERKRLEDERAHLVAVAGVGGDAPGAIVERLAAVDRDLADVAAREQGLRAEQAGLDGGQVREDDLRGALAEFDGLWATLAPAERARALRLLIQKITFDGTTGVVEITLRANGMRLDAHPEEKVQ